MEKKYSASVDKVYALLTDAKWLEARCLALGELSASCKTRKTPSVQVTMKRRVRRDLPAIVAKVLNPESDIELVEQWAAEGKGYRGSLALDIVGQPVHVTGDFELVPEGKGCVYRIQHHAKVKVPIIGGMIEKFVLGQTVQGCADELDYLADYLKTHK